MGKYGTLHYNWRFIAGSYLYIWNFPGAMFDCQKVMSLSYQRHIHKLRCKKKTMINRQSGTVLVLRQICANHPWVPPTILEYCDKAFLAFCLWETWQRWCDAGEKLVLRHMKKLEQHVDCVLVCASVCIPTTGRLSQLLHIEFDVSDGFVYHHSLCLFTSTMYSNLVLYIYI